jgi:hypothetical protein
MSWMEEKELSSSHMMGRGWDESMMFKDMVLGISEKKTKDIKIGGITMTEALVGGDQGTSHMENKIEIYGSCISANTYKPVCSSCPTITRGSSIK